MKKKIIATAFAAIIGVTTISGQSLAAQTANTNVGQKINGGTRDISVTPNTQFNDITLDGSVQTTHADPGVLSIKDASGTGEGYRVTASATQFKTVTPSGGFAAGTTAKTLPKGSLVLKNNSATITNVGGTTSQKPNWNGTSWLLDAGTTVTILNAGKDSGMGMFNVDFAIDNLELTLNPSTAFVDPVNYAGKATPYETTITYTIVSGP